ncbi:hypothetical protein [Cyclobacterium marinum]|uniref:Uncharacterized protein n=1 Tax=Cyclobacterium marinum (strain ATCC 25205 / DSM 745 / LMG 13164 / NCIMB 1802) TaxID=880070 RepID=G0IY01_CYCMS|nr:hypothetical protein [Cyclobacterium marinum]AEL24334.1 hypothetical protein Cycma_0559 [Cyclobacterium marinum DSM 745]
MAGRKNIKSRNEEVRQVFRHLRKIERRESSYCMEEISKNYHISQDRIYQILAQPDEPGCIENPSFYYQKTILQEQ